MHCTNIPPHDHPPCDVTYSLGNLDGGTGWGAYRYHCVELPCGSNRRAGKKRKWITGSVDVAEREEFTPCERCF